MKKRETNGSIDRSMPPTFIAMPSGAAPDLYSQMTRCVAQESRLPLSICSANRSMYKNPGITEPARKKEALLLESTMPSRLSPDTPGDDESSTR